MTNIIVVYVLSTEGNAIVDELRLQQVNRGADASSAAGTRRPGVAARKAAGLLRMLLIQTRAMRGATNRA
jgi:hypothetical protein